MTNPLDAVDVGLTCGELILSMINHHVLSIYDVNKAVVAALAVGVDDAIQADLTPNNRLQSGLGAIGDNFGVHTAVVFKNVISFNVLRN